MPTGAQETNWECGYAFTSQSSDGSLQGSVLAHLHPEAPPPTSPFLSVGQWVAYTFGLIISLLILKQGLSAYKSQVDL